MKKDKTPKELYTELRKSVCGQDPYLHKVCTTVWLHGQRLKANKYTTDEMPLQKHNLLCVGPTGSGKTLAITRLASIYKLDVYIADASGYTGTGWKGKDVSELISELYHYCKQDKERTEKAIVVLDEVDKMILQGQDRHRDASFCAENALLKILEGTTVDVDGTSIDTTNILFIAAGAFEGIEVFVKERINAGKLGFQPVKSEYIVDQDELLANIEHADLLRYGMGAQFLGRFADIAYLRKLNEKDLMDIILHSESSVVKSINRMLLLTCGVKVSVDRSGARAVANKAISEGTGARGIMQIILPLINDAIFNLDDKKEINEIRLSADKNGNLKVRQLKGPRAELPHLELKGTSDDIAITMPKKTQKNIEHFCWNVLRPYMSQKAMKYESIFGMYNLLCSIIYYLKDDCKVDDWNFTNIEKLIGSAVSHPGKGESIYEYLIHHNALTRRKIWRYNVYYRKYKELDPEYKLVPELEIAVKFFKENPELMVGNKYWKKAGKQVKRITH